MPADGRWDLNRVKGLIKQIETNEFSQRQQPVLTKHYLHQFDQMLGP